MKCSVCKNEIPGYDDPLVSHVVCDKCSTVGFKFHTNKDYRVTETEETFLIFHIEKGAYYKPFEDGYTAHFGSAGVYAKDQAFKICASRNLHALACIPIPCKYFEYQKKAHGAFYEVSP